jgi:MYXO-CTERM domain-containing protein
MKRLTWSLAACVAVLAGVAGPARADVLFSDLGPGESYNQNVGLTESGPTSLPGSVRQPQAFTVSTNTTFDSARVAISLANGANEMDLRLYNTVGGQPGAVLETIHVSGQMPNFGMFGSGHLVTFDSVLHPLLQAGGTYWLLPFSPGNTWAAWNFNTIGATGMTALSTDPDPTSWMVLSGVSLGAVEISGTPSPAPEPSGLALAGLAAAGLAGYTWLRRRQPAVA